MITTVATSNTTNVVPDSGKLPALAATSHSLT
jgi:hypothetical protein